MVVVVDDDKEFRELVSAVLTGEGFEVGGAANGADYISVYGTTQEAVLVLDLLMPRQTGMGLFDFLSQEKPLLPVIMASGHGNALLKVSADMAKEKGVKVVATFTKPLDLTAFKECLAKYGG